MNTNNRFFKTNFVFQANRYEEWQNCNCISRGNIDTEIVAEVYGDEIHFELSNIGNIRIVKSFDFEMADVLHDNRVQYVHGTSDINPIVPFICHLFNDGTTLQCVRFAMSNPDRLVEFYGKLTSYNQPSRGRKSEANNDIVVSAEKIFAELDSYGMLNTEALLSRTIKIYDDNFDLKSAVQVMNMVEALKMFVKAYGLQQEKNDYDFEEEDEHDGNPLTAKILMFIAICNFKICNMSRAYCIAKQAQEELDTALENSPFSIPKSMLGMDMLDELISVIETQYADETKQYNNYYDVDPTEISTKYVPLMVRMLS